MRANALQQRQEVARERARERNEKLKRLHQEAKEKFELAKQEKTIAWAAVERKFQQQREAFFEDYRREMSTIGELVEAAQSKSLAGVTARIEQTLKVESFPHFVPTEFALKFDEDSRILILEHEFPNVGAISWIKCVTVKSGQTTKAANQREAKDAALLLYPALTLRLACEVARLDLFDQIEAIVVNGWANYTEKSTGQTKRAYCSSLFSKKSELMGINLAAVDPAAAFAALKGVGARSLDLVPIAPVLKLNKEDSRFVDAKEILEKLTAGQNLAAMNWEDFEHLCRQLFEKAFAGSGAEVRVTQASRDQGVDAVIFDPDVLRGGKIVVQAKRYTNTVDVSAVRDLYGAIINEGATKGILVTTSHFGPDAYGFAKDKPITLLNGQELLGLLEKYGYTFRIDLAEARQLISTWLR
jgi:restriction system protein